MKVKVGIIGCGNISTVYFINCQSYENLEVVACADLDIARAKEKAKQFGIPHAYSVEEILLDPTIEIIINLTVPNAHADVCLKVLEAGKHVYVEKPLAATREEGLRVLEYAEDRGLLVASAPETFMGGGIQTCRKLIDDGLIGRPLSASAFMMSRGHEHWHPDPDFYYQPGGGPMFDMGPYYLTTLVSLLGPMSRVSGLTTSAYKERTITSKAKKGEIIQVNMPTHVSGLLEFSSGVVATIITSFDIFGGSDLPHIEIYGSKGTLSVPNPNDFGGPVLLRKMGESEWENIALTHGNIDNNRGIGVSDLAYAIRNKRKHRANSELAYHVLEAMHGIHEASNEGKFYEMKSTCEKPEPVPVGGIID